MWTVYIGVLGDGRYYVGMTAGDPKTRERQHKSGSGGRFTHQFGLTEIVWTERHETASSAGRRERQLKGWTHAKKQALIEGNIVRLKALACRRT